MRMLAVILALLVPSAADAAEINALISTALKAATDELLPPFERAHGHTIRASCGSAHSRGIFVMSPAIPGILARSEQRWGYLEAGAGGGI